MLPLSKEDKAVIETLRLASAEGIPTEGEVQNQL